MALLPAGSLIHGLTSKAKKRITLQLGLQSLPALCNAPVLRRYEDQRVIGPRPSPRRSGPFHFSQNSARRSPGWCPQVFRTSSRHFLLELTGDFRIQRTYLDEAFHWNAR